LAIRNAKSLSLSGSNRMQSCQALIVYLEKQHQI
jgi:hypothetical protein